MQTETLTKTILEKITIEYLEFKRRELEIFSREQVFLGSSSLLNLVDRTHRLRIAKDYLVSRLSRSELN